MGKAVFIAPHTLGYVGGFAAVAMLQYVWLRGWPTNASAADFAGSAVGMLFLGLLEAALFALGCAWAGVERLPRLSWAFVAGVATGIGLFAVTTVTQAVPPPTDLESHKRQGYIAALQTTYILVAPALSGLLAAWLWRLTARSRR